MHSEHQDGIGRLDHFRQEIFRLITRRKLDAAVTDPNGARPIVVVEEHELVSNVLVQARRTCGFANLFVLMDDNSLVGAAILPKESALNGETAEDFEAPIHRDAEVGMLLATAKQFQDGLSFHVRLPSQEGEVRNARPFELIA